MSAWLVARGNKINKGRLCTKSKWYTASLVFLLFPASLDFMMKASQSHACLCKHSPHDLLTLVSFYSFVSKILSMLTSFTHNTKISTASCSSSGVG